MARIFDIVEVPDMRPDDMVRRFPSRGSGDFRLGSQVIVRESQTAVFYRDGKALDTFSAGRHAISTNNIPLLIDLLGPLFRGSSPFKAEVYFVNMREFLEMTFGTPHPITMRDKELGMVRLRAFGNYRIQVSDPQMFVNKIVGTQGLYETEDIQNFLRSMLVSSLTDLLGSAKLSIFDLPAMYEELGAGLRAKLNDRFQELGLNLKQVVLQSVSPTEDTEKAIDERASMGAIGNLDAYLKFKAARAMGDAAQNQGGAGTGAGMGVGLGAGIGMGAGMAQMLTQAMQGAQQTAPAASAAPATPKTAAEIQAVLDNLDMRLANGELSESLYEKLTAKWQAKLKEMGG